jgi:uncharacterized protein (TIGR02145 family)
MQSITSIFFDKKWHTSILFYLLVLLISSCKPDKEDTIEPAPVLETGTVTDIDNHTYVTVKIGNQWWMAENLRTITYNDGSPLKKVEPNEPDSVWTKTKKGAYCGNYCYNWHAVNDPRGLAPKGWHIPTDNDWKQLEQHLGMSLNVIDNVNFRGTNQGDKLKTNTNNTDFTHNDYWGSNAAEQNYSGFSAIRQSNRMFNGKWTDVDINNVPSTAFWWASDSTTDGKVWYRGLDVAKQNIFRYYGQKTYGFNIRCVKD